MKEIEESTDKVLQLPAPELEKLDKSMNQIMEKVNVDEYKEKVEV